LFVFVGAQLLTSTLDGKLHLFSDEDVV